jgi:two-component system, NtrC family, sensor kinase
MEFINSLHKTLRRQIARFIGENTEIPQDWQNLLTAISNVYVHADEDRILTERSIDISSKELTDITKKQENETAVLVATLNATTDGILIIDEHNVIINYNTRFKELWNVSDITLKNKDIYFFLELISVMFENPEEYIKKAKDYYSDEGKQDIVALELKDGRIYDRYSQPLIIRGKYEGRVVSYRDVTKQKNAESELKEHSQELEKMNSFMINRELKMADLKKENEMLKQKLGI